MMAILVTAGETGDFPMRQPFKPKSLNRDRPLKRLNPLQPLDPYTRFAIFGRVQGMNYPTLMDRLLGR
jgi:hypothetical protein